MTKQEEIREGIAEFLGNVHDNFYSDMDMEIDKLLKYLHSKGAVIKVERELPLLRHIPMNAKETKEIKITIPEWWDEVSLVSYLGRIHQQDMLKAGYVAVEPLIKEVNVTLRV